MNDFEFGVMIGGIEGIDRYGKPKARLQSSMPWKRLARILFLTKICSNRMLVSPSLGSILTEKVLVIEHQVVF